VYILVKLLITPVSPSLRAWTWLVMPNQDTMLLRNADKHGLVQCISSQVLCSQDNHCRRALLYGDTPVLLCTPMRSEGCTSNAGAPSHRHLARWALRALVRLWIILCLSNGTLWHIVGPYAWVPDRRECRCYVFQPNMTW
jgi:hypothetical protein